jgi:hypothetical protein
MPVIPILDLSGKILFEVDVLDQGTCPDGLCLEGVDLMGVDLRSADLRNADLYWASISECDLRGASLAGASFRGASLRGAKFQGADLSGADFSQDNLGGATTLDGCDFSNADVSRAVWYGAEFDADTVFPDGFDPFDHEMYCPFEICGREDHKDYRSWSENRIKHWPVRFQQAR